MGSRRMAHLAVMCHRNVETKEREVGYFSGRAEDWRAERPGQKFEKKKTKTKKEPSPPKVQVAYR